VAHAFSETRMALSAVPVFTARSGRRGRWFESSHLDHNRENPVLGPGSFFMCFFCQILGMASQDADTAHSQPEKLYREIKNKFCKLVV
jgi:hypothetical protein